VHSDLFQINHYLKQFLQPFQPVVPEVSDSASGTQNNAPFATDFMLQKLINELMMTTTTPNFFYTDVV